MPEAPDSDKNVCARIRRIGRVMEDRTPIRDALPAARTRTRECVCTLYVNVKWTLDSIHPLRTCLRSYFHEFTRVIVIASPLFFLSNASYVTPLSCGLHKHNAFYRLESVSVRPSKTPSPELNVLQFTYVKIQMA